jgi:hypothetical protein
MLVLSSWLLTHQEGFLRRPFLSLRLQGTWLLLRPRRLRPFL